MNYDIVQHYGVTDPSLFDCSTIVLSNRHIIQYRLLTMIGNPFSKKQSKLETAYEEFVRGISSCLELKFSFYRSM